MVNALSALQSLNSAVSTSTKGQKTDSDNTTASLLSSSANGDSFESTGNVFGANTLTQTSGEDPAPKFQKWLSDNISQGNIKVKDGIPYYKKSPGYAKPDYQRNFEQGYKPEGLTHQQMITLTKRFLIETYGEGYAKNTDAKKFLEKIEDQDLFDKLVDSEKKDQVAGKASCSYWHVEHLRGIDIEHISEIYGNSN